jgi:hypothetical protein
MANEPSKEPTPDGWKAGDLVWEVAPDEVTPVMQAELEEHLANQRKEAQRDSVTEKVRAQMAKRRQAAS